MWMQVQNYGPTYGPGWCAGNAAGRSIRMRPVALLFVLVHVRRCRGVLVPGKPGRAKVPKHPVLESNGQVLLLSADVLGIGVDHVVPNVELHQVVCALAVADMQRGQCTPWNTTESGRQSLLHVR